MSAADPEALAALHGRAFTTPRPWSTAEFSDLLADPACFLVARPAGFALGRMLLDEAELLTIAVAPEHRRGGEGRALLQDFEAAARRRGALRGVLEVAADNAPALALYQGGGWAEAGRRRAYYRLPDGGRVDALVMARQFPPAASASG